MSIKIAVCDDTAEDIELLSRALSTYNPSFEILTFSSSKTLIDEFLENDTNVDLLFLDIYA